MYMGQIVNHHRFSVLKYTVSLTICVASGTVQAVFLLVLWELPDLLGPAKLAQLTEHVGSKVAFYVASFPLSESFKDKGALNSNQSDLIASTFRLSNIMLS